MAKVPPKNILILKYRALGDSIMGLSTIQYVRTLFPEAKIYYGVPGWVLPLYKNVTTAADEIIPIELNSISSWFRLWGQLKKLKLDYIFELHLAGRTSKFFKLFSLFTWTPYKFHNHHLKKKTNIHDQGVNKALIQRDLDGLYSVFGKDLPNYLDFSPKMMVEDVALKEKRLILGIVATRKTKMWSLENYAALTHLVAKSFPKYKIVVPLSNSKADKKIQENFLSYSPNANTEIVHLSLAELPALFAGSKLYVGNDTGLKHIAVSVGTKSFTFFGPEPPLEWHPYDEKKHPYFFFPLECRTAKAHYCGLSECESMECLEYFEPEEVFRAIQGDLHDEA